MRTVRRQGHSLGWRLRLAAPMPAPKPIPSRSPTAADHCAVYIAAARRDAPCSGSITTATLIATARHCGAFDKNMPMTADTCRGADKLHKRIPSGLCAGFRARMTGRARSVHLPRRNACKPNAWSFLAPDRPVTVPDVGWRASECLTRRDGR